jgi:hypothetical protein
VCESLCAGCASVCSGCACFLEARARAPRFCRLSRCSLTSCKAASRSSCPPFLNPNPYPNQVLCPKLSRDNYALTCGTHKWCALLVVKTMPSSAQVASILAAAADIYNSIDVSVEVSVCLSAAYLPVYAKGARDLRHSRCPACGGMRTSVQTQPPDRHRDL